MQHTVSVLVERPMPQVHAYLLDGAHLPEWSFFTSAEPDGPDRWRVSSPEGGALLRFLSSHEHGVLDHVVETDDGHHVMVPLRVAAHHGGGTDVTLVVEAATREQLDRDVATVEADLARLKQVLESRP